MPGQTSGKWGLPVRVGPTANQMDNTQIENTNYASVGHRAIGLVKSTVLARNEMLISARLLTIRSFYKKVKNVAT